jgi:hypothetical protein
MVVEPEPSPCARAHPTATPSPSFHCNRPQGRGDARPAGAFWPVWPPPPAADRQAVRGPEGARRVCSHRAFQPAHPAAGRADQPSRHAGGLGRSVVCSALPPTPCPAPRALSTPPPHPPRLLSFLPPCPWRPPCQAALPGPGGCLPGLGHGCQPRQQCCWLPDHPSPLLAFGIMQPHSIWRSHFGSTLHAMTPHPLPLSPPTCTLSLSTLAPVDRRAGGRA